MKIISDARGESRFTGSTQSAVGQTDRCVIINAVAVNSVFLDVFVIVVGIEVADCVVNVVDVIIPSQLTELMKLLLVLLTVDFSVTFQHVEQLIDLNIQAQS